MDDINNTLAKIYPNGLTGKEIIYRITQIYHADYDLNNLDFDIYNQLLACESIDESQKEYEEKNNKTNKNVGVSGSVHGSSKQEENSEQKLSKHQAIAKLKLLNYKSPPTEIELCLNTIFGRWEKRPKHWLSVAQYHTPKTINSVLAQMIKQHRRKDISIRNAGAYFTSVIKYRPKRKIFRRTNGSSKHNNL